MGVVMKIGTGAKIAQMEQQILDNEADIRYLQNENARLKQEIQVLRNPLDQQKASEILAHFFAPTLPPKKKQRR